MTGEHTQRSLEANVRVGRLLEKRRARGGDLAACRIIVGDQRLVLVFALERDALEVVCCRLHDLVRGVGLHGRHLSLQLVFDLLRQLLVGDGLKLRGGGLANGGRQRRRLSSLARNGYGRGQGAINGVIHGGRTAGLTFGRDCAL